MGKKNLNGSGIITVTLDSLHNENERLKIILCSFSKASTRLSHGKVKEIRMQLSDIIRKRNGALSASELVNPKFVMVEIKENFWKRVRGIN